MAQGADVGYATGNTKFEYSTLSTLTITEEDGKLKISDTKGFSDPEKRGNFHGYVSRSLAQGNICCLNSQTLYV